MRRVRKPYGFGFNGRDVEIYADGPTTVRITNRNDAIKCIQVCLMKLPGWTLTKIRTKRKRVA